MQIPREQRLRWGLTAPSSVYVLQKEVSHLATLHIEVASSAVSLVRADLDHSILRMQLAKPCHLAAVYVEKRFFSARGTRALPVADVDHAVLGVSLAVHCTLASTDIVKGYLRASLVQTTLEVDAGRSILRVVFAECRRLAAFDVEERLIRA